MPPAIAYVIWRTVPQVGADFTALWQASPVFLVLLLICAGIMTMLLPIAVVWGLWLRRAQRDDANETVVC